MQIRPSPRNTPEMPIKSVTDFSAVPMALEGLGVSTQIAAIRAGIPIKSADVCSRRSNTVTRYQTLATTEPAIAMSHVACRLFMVLLSFRVKFAPRCGEPKACSHDQRAFLNVFIICRNRSHESREI